MSDSRYAPGTYAKGDQKRVARSTADGVALVFEGFKRVDDSVPAASPTAPEVPVTPGAPNPATVFPPKPPQGDGEGDDTDDTQE